MLCSQSAGAQKSYRITTNNGLSTNNLTVVLRDRNNYMWIGSFDGVQKHEGARVKVYRVGAVDSLSLRSNEVHGLFEDRQGFIWAGTMAGLDRIDPKTDVIRHYQLKNPDPGQDNGYLYSIFQDKRDSIWISSDFGMFRVHPGTGAYRQVRQFDTSGNGVYSPMTGYRGSYATDAGVWLYTISGLVFYEYGSGKFYNRYYNPGHKKIFNIAAGMKIGANGELCSDQKGNLFFIANDSILVRYNILQDHIDYFPFARPPLSWQCCYSLAADHEGNIWIGFRHGGLLVFEPSTTTFTPIRFEGINSLIGSNYVYSLAEDYLHTMWVTTNNGVYAINRYAKGVQQLYLSDRKDFTDLQYATRMLTEGVNGDLYLPFGKGGLIVYNPYTQAKRYYPAEGNTTSYDLVFHGPDGTTWIGTNGSFHPATVSTKTLSINRAKELRLGTSYKKEPRTTWMIAAQRTLFIKSNKGFILSVPENGRMERLPAYGFMKQMCLSADSQSLYYLNAQLELTRRTIATQKQDTFFVTPLLKKLGVAYSDPRDLIDDGNGHIWIASQNGVIRYRLADRTLQVYSLSKGLQNAFSFALCRDRKNGIWVATLGGISRYDAAADVFRTVHYFSSSTYQDGYGSALLLQNSEVAFFVGNRLIRIDPDRIIPQQPAARKLQVNSIEVNGKLVNAETPMFSLSYNQNQLRITFGLLDFENASKVKYFFNLNGATGDWKPLGNQSELFFYSLAPGTYVLKLKAVDGSGNAVAATLERVFVIHPPFCKSGWFFGLLLLLLLAGVTWAYLFFRKRYQTQKYISAFVASLTRQMQVEGMALDIATNCVGILGFPAAAVYLLDDETDLLKVKAACTKAANNMEAQPLQAIALKNDPLGAIVRKGKATVLHNRLTGARHAMHSQAVRSELVVPIVADGHVYGLVYAWGSEEGVFTSQHLAVLTEVMDASAVRISKYFTEDRLRSKIAQDLHDDLGSALSSININSRMALDREAHPEVKVHLQKIQHNSGNMMESMSDMVWAIDPQNDTLEKVIFRMKEFAGEILEPLNIAYCFAETGIAPGLDLDLAKRKNFYLIFKEAINNAAKYSGGTQVMITIEMKRSELALLVQDNGIGFDLQNGRKGNGLRNMEERATDVGATLQLRSEQGKGTTIQLRMPIT